MSISNTNRKAGPFTGNGTASSFPFYFKVFEAADLQVVRLDVGTSLETILTLTADYTVTLNANQDATPGGSVVLTAGALASGYLLTITSAIGNLQPTNLTNQGGFYPDVIEDALDRATIQIQQMSETLDRAVTIPISSTANTQLPYPQGGTVIGWDDTGTSLVNLSPEDIASQQLYANWKYDTFAGDGTTTQFTLQSNPGNIANMDVSVSGVTQLPGTDYTLSGTTIAFTTAPGLDLPILVRYGQATVQTNVTYSQEVFNVTSGTVDGTGKQTIFNLTSSYSPGNNGISVYLNGSRLVGGSDYTETTSTRITLSKGAFPGDVVLVITAEPINANVTDAAQVSYTPAGIDAVPTNIQSKLRETVSVKDFGAAGNGSTPDNLAFSNAASSGALSVLIPSGTYYLNSSITINTPLIFTPGAILKPASGVTITLEAAFQASISSQIFDLSLGGLIALPRETSDVWVEWWGALGNGYLGVGSGAKLDNNVPIQQAIDAVHATVQGVEGGRVNINRGTFYISAQINIPNQVSIVGTGTLYPAIIANPTGWSASSAMFYSSNGTSSMFNSRIENIRIKANNVANISYVVRSVAWQEKCGLRNVLITDFSNYGFYYDTGYGGAAELTLQDVEIWAGAGAATCIRVDVSSYTVGWLQLNVNRATLAGASSQQTGLSGINVSGRVIANLNSVHFEYLENGIVLQNASCLTGQVITASGNNDVTQIINCALNWTGTIDASNVKKAGATNLIVDSNRPYPIANVQPYDDRLAWPPNPNRVFASATVFTAGSSPVLTYSQNINSITRTAAGTYRLDFTTAAYTNTYYDLICTSQDGTVIEIAAQNQTASYFYVYTRNTSGVLTDSFAGFSVRAYHRP